MERITDEEGATLETYTDLLGNKVLERHDGDNDTYYIYNDAGLLTYVLPVSYTHLTLPTIYSV